MDCYGSKNGCFWSKPPIFESKASLFESKSSTYSFESNNLMRPHLFQTFYKSSPTSEASPEGATRSSETELEASAPPSSTTFGWIAGFVSFEISRLNCWVLLVFRFHCWLLRCSRLRCPFHCRRPSPTLLRWMIHRLRHCLMKKVQNGLLWVKKWLFLVETTYFWVESIFVWVKIVYI